MNVSKIVVNIFDFLKNKVFQDNVLYGIFIIVILTIVYIGFKLVYNNYISGDMKVD